MRSKIKSSLLKIESKKEEGGGGGCLNPDPVSRRNSEKFTRHV